MHKTSLRETLKLYVGLHLGLIIVFLFFLATKINLADIYTSLDERFNVKDSSSWGVNSCMYVYVDFISFVLAALTAITVVKKKPICFYDMLLSSVIGAILTIIFLVNDGINQALNSMTLDTVYYWQFIAVVFITIFGFFRPLRFHLTQRFVHLISLCTFLFMVFLHANFIFNGLYPLTKKIEQDQVSSSKSLVNLSNTVPLKSYIEFVSSNSDYESTIISWGSGDVVPSLSEESKKVFDHYVEKDFSMAWFHIDSKRGRSDPAMIVELAARKDGKNYAIETTIDNDVSASIYPQFYRMVYFSMIAFIFAWISLLCFILVKHQKLGMPKS